MVHYLVRGGFPSQVDGMVVSAAASATMLGQVKQNDYKSVMLMPKVTHKLVGSPDMQMGKGANPSSISCLLMNDIPGTSRFFMERLQQRGGLWLPKVQEFAKDPDEIFQALQSGVSSLATVMFFPHYKINEFYNKSVSLETPTGVSEGVDHVLFLHKRHQDKHCATLLNVEIRHAWIQMLKVPGLLDAMLDSLFEDQSYVTLLKSCCGLSVA